MGIAELFFLAVGLSMDAFAVSVCKGLAMERVTVSRAGVVGLWFGGFQALMPLIGYWLGSRFQRYITSVDHWIAFILLAIIGINMIREARCGDGEHTSACVSPRAMFPLAVATSIDALAVGITFAFLSAPIVPAITFIGVITCILSMLGVRLGSTFGTRWQARAEFAGGAILILLGSKILLEHLGLF